MRNTELEMTVILAILSTSSTIFIDLNYPPPSLLLEAGPSLFSPLPIKSHITSLQPGEKKAAG